MVKKRLCHPWQRRYRRGSLVEQLLQLDSAIVTVYAARFARLRTNRANDASQVKHMFYGRCRALGLIFSVIAPSMARLGSGVVGYKPLDLMFNTKTLLGILWICCRIEEI